MVGLLASLTPENHQDREKVEALVEESNEALGKVPSIANARGRVDQRLRGMTGGGRFDQKSTLAFGDPIFMRIVGALRAKIGELVALEMEQNGLGFNNLLYMAVLLAAIADAPDDEDPFLRVMLVEEPEAHLHPQLQDLLMKFIEGEASADGATQVIVTSHSPSFASSAQVERLAVMSRPTGSAAPVGRLPAAFGLESEQLAYLRRFLDVTKASLFFARGVILVEGIAEQLLVPELARRAGMDLAPAGVSVINIGGVAFAPFTDLFADGGLPYRLAVISDADPKDDQEVEAAVGGDEALSARAALLKNRVQGSQNAEAFFASQTLEWDLARIAANRPLMIEALRPVKPRVAAKLPGALEGLGDDAAASKILNAIGREKGPFAQALAELLADDGNTFEAPGYLERAIEWSQQDGIFTTPVEADADDADDVAQAGSPVVGQ
ncbi:MAG: ATP-dependent nuclease [Solirubrobacterales bacterium]